MRPNELMAAAILSELLDARAELNDGPRTGPGRFDRRLIGRDRTYAIEVTEHNDQAQRSFEAQTTAAGGIYREQPTLDGFYSIRVEPASAPSKLWSQLPALIRDHFSDGVDFQELASIRWNTDNPRHTYARTLADLGVLWITAQRSVTTPVMQITADAGWWEHPDVVAEAAASELEPNRDKLAAATDVDERHLFIWINWSAAGAHYSLRGADAVPTAPLNLGRGIDVVWVAGMDITFRPPSSPDCGVSRQVSRGKT